jgi:DNA segregation ATPase FtsK/SpoIIIE, S-DNA-T family
VVLVGAGLLALVGELFGQNGPLLRELKTSLDHGFGAGWPLPVAAALAIGVLFIWPEPPAIRKADIVAVLTAALALLGLLSFRDAGGTLGSSIEGFLGGLAGPWGAGILLMAALVVGLIVAFHFSPGALAMGVVDTARAGYAERRRVEALVRPAAKPGAQDAKAKPTKPERPAAPPSAAEAPLDLPAWVTDEDEVPEPAPAPRDALAAPASGPDPGDVGPPVMRVTADLEDEPPKIDWKLPSVNLLDNVTARKERMQDEIRRNVRVIEHTLTTFGVDARVIGVNPGPAVTQYELQPAAGVAVKKITALQHDLELALAASPLRVEAPIPGKSAVGIEVPNKSASLVSMRECVEAPGFRAGHKLAIVLGNDVSGTSITGDLARMPHLLIAGATGQGKSVCINVLISSLLLQCTPEDLRLVMIDPKRVELSGYNNLPHLAVPVIVESHQAASALRWAVAEMERRYKLLSHEGVRNIASYNDRAALQNARKMPYVVIVIDELADLMMVAAGEVEELICRIAQLARAVGIHLVIATQRPSTDIITGLIKANIPSRIAFAVGSQVDSRVILDSGGAEKLLGRGDMLYQPVDAGKPARIQGAFVNDREVEALVGFWKSQGEPRYIEEVLDSGPSAYEEDAEGGGRRLDPLFARAARAVAAEGAASVSLVQRKFNVGYSRAGRIVDQLAEHRVIGGYQGSKSREVLLNLPDVDELLERLGVE